MPPPLKTSYRLPFRAGERYLCTQSRTGLSTHQGSVAHAVDFAMKDGTEVCAARDGRVVAIRSDGERGGPSPALAVHMNYIHIDHGDGTLGRYLHLRRNGVLVRPGEAVRQGEVIGLAGSTGFSSGPHLHFDVWKAGSTLPFAFDDVDTDGGVAQAGRFYESKNAPVVPAALRRELEEAFRTAELFREAGAFQLAYPVYARVASERRPAAPEAQTAARARMDELAAAAERTAAEAAEQARGGAWSEALGRLAPALAAFNGIPGSQKIRRACEELRKRNGADGVLATLDGTLKAQERFWEGLRREADGGREAAARTYGEVMAEFPGTPSAEAAQARLATLASRPAGERLPGGR